MRILNLHGFMGEADNKNYKAFWEVFPTESLCGMKMVYGQLITALGDDTDTTACITGGLAGAEFGYNNILHRWLNALR